MNDSQRCFVDVMDTMVARDHPDTEMAAEAQRSLGVLLDDPGVLTDEQRAAHPDRYAQHIVHVHPEGAYSVVSLVWLPGQQTPIHDHRCWCVVGVLSGREEETRYQFWEGDAGRELTVSQVSMNDAGDICALVPPADNIHKVANASDGVTISLHVYGADIAVLGTSINQVFIDDVRSAPPPSGVAVSWRRSTR